MDRQELLEYLRTTGLYHASIDYWYNSNLYCFDTFTNNIGSYDYFFTELVKYVWKKIYGNQDIDEKIGIKLLKFLCGMDNRSIYGIKGNTSVLDDATVYKKGMLDIAVNYNGIYCINGYFIVDCVFHSECFVDINWCIKCNYCKRSDSRIEMKHCYNCSECLKMQYCSNCNNCSNCDNCDNCNDCIDTHCGSNNNKCKNCTYIENSTNCKNMNKCKNCNNCSSCNDCINCCNCKNCNLCKDCDNCSSSCQKCDDCKNIQKCKSCKSCEDCDNCQKCDDCKNIQKCKSCKSCEDCDNCQKCDDCKNIQKCKNCTSCTDCITSENCKNCTTCEECNRCVDCTNCKKCSGCKNCSNCNKCINQKNMKDISEKYFNRIEINIPKEIITFRRPVIVDLSVNGDRIEMNNAFIQYYDSNNNLLFQGICQYKHPLTTFYKNYDCMNFAVGQGWFYYPDTHEPRCYVILSTKSKYNITIQDVVNFCDTNNSNNDFIEFLQTRTMKMKNSDVYIYDRSGNLMRNESTFNI